jgi:hypothetical protein
VDSEWVAGGWRTAQQNWFLFKCHTGLKTKHQQAQFLGARVIDSDMRPQNGLYYKKRAGWPSSLAPWSAYGQLAVQGG